MHWWLVESGEQQKMDPESRATDNRMTTDNRSRNEILIIETSFGLEKNTHLMCQFFSHLANSPANHSSVFVRWMFEVRTVISFYQIVASNSISICNMLMFNVHSTRKWSVHTRNVHILWFSFFIASRFIYPVGRSSVLLLFQTLKKIESLFFNFFISHSSTDILTWHTGTGWEVLMNEIGAIWIAQYVNYKILYLKNKKQKTKRREKTTD